MNKELYVASIDDVGQFCYQRFAELVRQDEREVCAKLCDEARAARLAEQIRARSEPSPAFKNYMGDNWAGIV